MGILLAASACAAHAATINVWACHGPDGQTAAPLDRWSSSINAPYIDATNTCAANGQGAFALTVYAQPHPAHTWGSWLFTAPANTSVTAFNYSRAWSVWGWSSFQGFRGTQPIWDSPHLFELCQAAGGCHDMPLSAVGTGLSNDTGVLLFLESCALSSGCDSSSNGWAQFTWARVTLEDDSAPTFSTLSGSLASGTALRGTASLSFQLADSGVGLYRLHATVDGRSFDDRTLDTNGGRCVPLSAGSRDFGYAVPCPLSASAGTRLDTTTLTDGQHSVVLTVEDAAGNTTTIFNDTVTTHNAPALLTRPQISGTTSIGSQLAASPGTWSPTPTAYGYQWLRCPATVTSPNDMDSCLPIAGATRSTYAPVDADVYGRVMVDVTAGNASGSDSSVSAPSALIADAQGRTVAPVPDPGGSRDVIVVPEPGASSSSTTIINNGGSTTFPIAGLSNPLGKESGHVANGTGASENARIEIAFQTGSHGHGRASVVRSTRNHRWVIAGRLRNADGHAIGAGQLVAAWQINGRWVAHTGVRTRGDGSFVYVLPKGPSRALKFIYFAYSDSTSYAESNTISEKVATPVTFGVTPHAARNRHTVRFSGTVGTDNLPRAGVLVTLEASYPGGPWKQFEVVRTRAGGHFSATYEFTRTTSTTRYRFRARVAKQADYPFDGGTSTPTSVLVTP